MSNDASDSKTTAEWRPFTEHPTKATAGLVFFGRRVWTDIEGQPCALSAIRDLAERTEPAFFEDGQWWEAGTGHAIFDGLHALEDLPTHWMQITGPLS